MKFVATCFIAGLPTITNSIAAAYLCERGASGWGWFILLAVITLPTVKISRGSDD